MKCREYGCNQEAWRQRDGKQFRLCKDHLNEHNRQLKHEREAARALPEYQERTDVMVCVVDYVTERVYYVKGQVERSEHLPLTNDQLLKKTAQAAQFGYFVAKNHAFKPEDLA